MLENTLRIFFSVIGFSFSEEMPVTGSPVMAGAGVWPVSACIPMRDTSRDSATLLLPGIFLLTGTESGIAGTVEMMKREATFD